MILKLELFIDVDPSEKAKRNLVEYKEDLNEQLMSDALNGHIKNLLFVLEKTSNSYEIMSKEEILERMRTNGKK